MKYEISSLKRKIGNFNKDLIETAAENMRTKAELVSIKRDKCLFESEIEGLRFAKNIHIKILTYHMLFVSAKNQQLQDKEHELRAVMTNNDALQIEKAAAQHKLKGTPRLFLFIWLELEFPNT